MQSIYWVLSWACHRKCPHCYDDRFRPYVRDGLRAVVGEGQGAWPRILAHLPERMRWTDPKGTDHPTTLVLAGGELLIDGVREELFYPVLAGIRARWGDDGPRVSVQTTGDIMTEQHAREMIAQGVSTIAIASIDDYHVGHSGEGKFRLMARIRALMARLGVREVSLGIAKDERLNEPKPARTEGGRHSCFSARSPICGSANCGRAGEPGPTGWSKRITRRISARAGQARKAFSSMVMPGRKWRSSPMARSIRAASRRRRHWAAWPRNI